MLFQLGLLETYPELMCQTFVYSFWHNMTDVGHAARQETPHDGKGRV